MADNVAKKVEREEKDKTAKKKKRKKKEKKEKSEADYCMSRKKIEAWSKDDAFKFGDTADGKPVENKTKRVTWLEISESEEIFTCWICQKFPSVCNKENKVTRGCKTWYINYLLHHDDIKHNNFPFEREFVRYGWIHVFLIFVCICVTFPGTFQNSEF